MRCDFQAPFEICTSRGMIARELTTRCVYHILSDTKLSPSP